MYDALGVFGNVGSEPVNNLPLPRYWRRTLSPGGCMNPTTSQSEIPSLQIAAAPKANSAITCRLSLEGLIPRQNSVRDISATGAFLVTQGRWEPGEIIALTLQRSGPLEKDNSFSIQARAVRWDDQGVAISFVLPPGADLRLWQSPLKSAAEQNEPEDILREFRVSRLSHFCRAYRPKLRS